MNVESSSGGQVPKLCGELLQNLEPYWQLFGKINIFNENFGSLPSLSLTLNAER